MDETPKFNVFTEVLLNLVSDIIDQHATRVLILTNLQKGFFNATCKGVGLSLSNIKRIHFEFQINIVHRYTKKILLEGKRRSDWIETLCDILLLSEKVVLRSTDLLNVAHKLVYHRGNKVRISKTTPKNWIGLEILVEGLALDIPHRISKIDIYEYQILRKRLSALALVKPAIPIKVRDQRFGLVLNWPGKYTGLGSAFSALIRSEVNNILPVHANFDDIRISGFFGKNLHANKYLQYIYINYNFVRGKRLYRIINSIFYKEIGNYLNDGNGYFIFALNFDCPDSKCIISHRNFAPEIQPQHTNSFVACLRLLLLNIKMLENCINPLDKNTKDSIRNQTNCLTGEKNIEEYERSDKLVRLFNHTPNQELQYLTNPFQQMIYNFYVSYLTNNQFILPTCLKFKRMLRFLYSNADHTDNVCESSRVINSMKKSLISNLVRNKEPLWLLNSCRSADIMTPMLKRLFANLKPMVANEFDIASLLSKRKCKRIRSSEIILNSLNNPCNDIELSNIMPINCSSANQMKFIEYKFNDENPKTLFITNQPARDLRTSKVILENNSTHLNPNKLKAETLNHNFNVVDRNHYIPKGTSPIMTKKVKLNLNHENIFAAMMKNIDALHINLNDDCKNKSVIKKQNNYNYDIKSISNKLLKDIKVVGQVDSKYIICKYGLDNQHEDEGTVVILDQHGIDERVQYENLLDLTSNQYKYIMKEQWIVLCCSDYELKLILQFSNFFSKFGFEFNSFSTESVAFTSIPHTLDQLAKYWTSNAPEYYNYVFKIVKEAVAEQIHSITENGCITNVLPSSLHKEICRTACAIAVKFGRSLSLAECEKIVNKLSKCKVPFRCAHGRRTAIFIDEGTTKENVAPPTLGLLRQHLLK